MRGLISLAILVGFVLICVLVLWLASKYKERQKEVIKRAWEPYCVSQGGYLTFYTQLKATKRDGTVEVEDDHELGEIKADAPDYDVEFERLWDTAITRSYRLTATLEPFA